MVYYEISVRYHSMTLVYYGYRGLHVHSIPWYGIQTTMVYKYTMVNPWLTIVCYGKTTV